MGANAAFIFVLQTLFYSQVVGSDMSQDVISVTDVNRTRPTKKKILIRLY